MLDKERQIRIDAAIESAQTLQLDYSLLDIEEKGSETELRQDALPMLAEADEREQSEPASNFDWDACLPEQMLSFSEQDLPAILDLSTDIRPSRKAVTRYMPANVIFLAARYASRYAGEDLLGELMIGAIDRIEASIHVSGLHAWQL